LKDEEAIDWCKRISKLSLDKGNKLKEGHGGLQRERIWGLCKRKKKGKKENVCEEGVFSSYVWRGAHGRVCVGIKHEGTCVRSACGKTFGLLVQLVVSPKSTVGFVSKLN
jgi:hypothetical protein